MAADLTNALSIVRHRLMRLMLIVAVVIGLSGVAFPAQALTSSGEELFNNHCIGCHVNGGNIIRRGRTLKLAALKRNGIDDPEAIARIAREGIGQMSGYGDVLGEGGDRLVSEWIWDQAQNAWIQG